MSRIGRQPILIPSGVTFTLSGNVAKVRGPKGELAITIRPEVNVLADGQTVVVSPKSESKSTPAYWGLTRALLANMIRGVLEGFEKKLELVGVGYRAKAINGGVSLSLGYSHPVDILAPKGVELVVVDQQNITVKGADKQQVGEIAAKIRKMRKPEPYKGKGIKYANEVVRRKPGKSAKT